jgi:hypothetical protein
VIDTILFTRLCSKIFLGNATPEEFAAQVDPETTALDRDFEAAKNGLYI